jgi:hypothetical protein
MTIALHKEALLSKRGFWQALLHKRVTFSKLAAATARIEESVRTAERMYRSALGRHAGSVDMLALYVRFLRDVRCDPWAAARWSAEVEKLQHLEEEANQRCAHTCVHACQARKQKQKRAFAFEASTYKLVGER